MRAGIGETGERGRLTVLSSDFLPPDSADNGLSPLYGSGYLCIQHGHLQAGPSGFAVSSSADLRVGCVHRMLCIGQRHLLLGCSNHSLPHTYLRRRSPTATLRRTTRHSWCCRPCQRWIQEPSILGEVESGRQHGTLSMQTKVMSTPRAQGSPSTFHL